MITVQLLAVVAMSIVVMVAIGLTIYHNDAYLTRTELTNIVTATFIHWRGESLASTSDKHFAELDELVLKIFKNNRSAVRTDGDRELSLHKSKMSAADRAELDRLRDLIKAERRKARLAVLDKS